MTQRRTWLSLGAVVLVVNALQWVIAEAVTAGAWKTPPYSYASNYISDLGVPDCGVEFQGREICSPSHDLMNTSFMAEGILFAIGVLLLARTLEGRTRRIVTALAVAHAVGFVMIGTFHGSPEGASYVLALHLVGAVIGVLSANAVVFMAGRVKNLDLPRPYRVFSMTVGVLGPVSVLGAGISESTAGAFERGGVYSFLLWSVVTGVLLLARNLRRPAVVENALV
jgi:hypothetical membrane protein